MTDAGGTSPDPGRGGQRRPLAEDEREALRRVMARLETAPGYADMISPGMRSAAGGETGSPHPGLTAADCASLRRIVFRLADERIEPRLAQGESPARDLSGADVARLALIWLPEGPDTPVFVNAVDWAPPQAVPEDWVIANAPCPVRAPAGAMSWQGEELHGRFYAAWPRADDDDAYWEAGGLREVEVFSNLEIAEKAGRLLGTFGLLPGDTGLTVREVARRWGHPWKEGILDDEQATAAALATGRRQARRSAWR
jgi:hypothetical protein